WPISRPLRSTRAGADRALASGPIRHHASPMMEPERAQPRYDHLLEVLDGAASLRMAIMQAEEALMEPDLTQEDRSLLETVLEASRERMERVASALQQPNLDAFEANPDEHGEIGLDWSERDLVEAGRAASEGSTEAERQAARAIDRLGRSME